MNNQKGINEIFKISKEIENNENEKTGKDDDFNPKTNEFIVNNPTYEKKECIDEKHIMSNNTFKRGKRKIREFLEEQRKILIQNVKADKQNKMNQVQEELKEKKRLIKEEEKIKLNQIREDMDSKENELILKLVEEFGKNKGSFDMDKIISKIIEDDEKKTAKNEDK